MAYQDLPSTSCIFMPHRVQTIVSRATLPRRTAPHGQ